MIPGRKFRRSQNCTRRDRGTPTAIAVFVLSIWRDRGIIDRDRGISPGGSLLYEQRRDRGTFDRDRGFHPVTSLDLSKTDATAALVTATAVFALFNTSLLRGWRDRGSSAAIAVSSLRASFSLFWAWTLGHFSISL